jgi:hypothetical protein
MRVFEHPSPGNGWKCPVCGKPDDKPVVLIAIRGTENGNKAQAEQFHLDCLEPWYYPDQGAIVQTWKGENK